MLLFACKDSNLKLAASDATPPIGKWVVTDSGDGANIVTKEFSESYNEWDVSPHQKVNIVFNVEDIDGGVKKVAIWGGGLTACPLSLQDDIEEISISADTLVLTPGKNKEVQPVGSRSVFLDMACRRKAGEVFPQVARGPGGTIELTGYGENHHGGKVSSKLVIKTSVQ
jgi:hypothetical protein